MNRPPRRDTFVGPSSRWGVATLGAAALAIGALTGCRQETPPPPAAVAPAPPVAAPVPPAPEYQRSIYSPLHFRPAIRTASDEQCLACHKEVLEDRTRALSPAGVSAQSVRAWYQQVDTYSGEQDTFHRRHLASEFSRGLMNLKCNTCHDGHDPREEAPNPPTATDAGFTLRKQVNPETTCLKCHGQMDWKLMGLPSPWEESKSLFAGNCLTCHQAIRTTRHQVNYLDAGAIERAGRENANVCHGCHGGRPWYAIAYPYPRHDWPGMAPEVPDWAKGRPTESEARFRLARVTTDAPRTAK